MKGVFPPAGGASIAAGLPPVAFAGAKLWQPQPLKGGRKTECREGKRVTG